MLSMKVSVGCRSQWQFAFPRGRLRIRNSTWQYQPVQYHYFYQRTQRRSAGTLLINVLVLLGMFFAAHRWLDGTEAGRQILWWINIVAPIVCTVLLALAAYFWVKNGAFRLTVDDTHFEIDEPFIMGSSFSVAIRDIAEIRQIHEKHVGHSKIVMRMKCGKPHRITMNRSFSRKKLYAALLKVNADIQLPESPLRFKQV